MTDLRRQVWKYFQKKYMKRWQLFKTQENVLKKSNGMKEDQWIKKYKSD